MESFLAWLIVIFGVVLVSCFESLKKAKKELRCTKEGLIALEKASYYFGEQPQEKDGGQ